MDIKILREVLASYVNLETNEVAVKEKYWNKLTEILSGDIPSTICYFENECTDEEFYWLSSVFEDVMKKTESTEFLQAVKDRLERVTSETYNQEKAVTEFIRKFVAYDDFVRDISTEIGYAEEVLNAQKYYIEMTTGSSEKELPVFYH